MVGESEEGRQAWTYGCRTRVPHLVVAGQQHGCLSAQRLSCLYPSTTVRRYYQLTVCPSRLSAYTRAAPRHWSDSVWIR